MNILYINGPTALLKLSRTTSNILDPIESLPGSIESLIERGVTADRDDEAEGEKSRAPGGSKISARKSLTISGAIALLIVGSVGGFMWWQNASSLESTDDAYVDGHIVNISSRISGVVSRVMVTDNQMVNKGDVLAQLDPEDYQVKVEQAKANLLLAQRQMLAARLTTRQDRTSARAQSIQASGEIAQAQGSVEAAKSAIPGANAEVAQAQSDLDVARAQSQKALTDFQRYQALLNEGAVSRQDFDNVKTAYEVASANERSASSKLNEAISRVAQAKANLTQTVGQMTKSRGMTEVAEAAAQQTDVQKEQAEIAEAGVEKAQADLSDAQTQLSYTTITAPVSGRIGKKQVEIGQSVDKGQAILAVVPSGYWVTANFKETQVGRIHPGQKVDLKIDAFPGHEFHGTVDSIAPASGAEFALLPPENATGNFTKVVQRVPVKIDLDPASIKGYTITAGMSVIPEIHVNS